MAEDETQSEGVAEDAEVDAASVDEAPADEAPADGGPADEPSTDEAPAEDASSAGPADEGPADAGPADAGPADEGAADGPDALETAATSPADDGDGASEELEPIEPVEVVDADEEEEHFLPTDLPDPYCQTRWREMVGGLLVVAALVAGVTIYNHRSGGLRGSGGALAALDPTPLFGAPAATPAAAVMPAGVMPGVVASPMATPVALTAPAAAGGPRTAFNAAAHAVRPSVVGIRAVGAGAPGAPGFERVGSGVIVHSGGYVLTCTHVIAGAQQISVSRFRHAAERLPAQVVATEGDLSLLRVAGNVPMPVARFADPNGLGVGDWVLALGHPFGMGLSVSAGIVGRRNAELTLPGGVRQPGLLQTDASINEGSSGGPLVNLNGEVVGLNMAILAPTGVFSGASFAIEGRRALDFVQRHLGPATALGQRALGGAQNG